MRMVIGGSVLTGTADPTLLKAVARGRKWFNELASGRAKFTQRSRRARESMVVLYDVSFRWLFFPLQLFRPSLKAASRPI